MRIGPMFSSKTTWLNFTLTELAENGFKTLKIIHADDYRVDVASNDRSGSTHNPSYTSLTAKIDCIRAQCLADVDVDKYHAIGVDEASFWPDLIETITNWVDVKGKHVRVVGLDGDVFKLPFGKTLDLIPHCDEVIKLSARCKICLDNIQENNFHGNIMTLSAPFTKRLGGNTEQKVVGGKDLYIPVCRHHHDK